LSGNGGCALDEVAEPGRCELSQHHE
jgi:hypothetical protein